MINEEIAEKLGLQEDQVKEIKNLYESSVADLKKEYDETYSKTANENAEKILDGAASKVFEQTKVPRQQGEKLADYYNRAWSEFNSSKVSEIEKLQNEYNEKVKNFKGNDDISKALSEYKEKYDALQAKEAEFDSLLSSGIKEEHETLKSKYEGMKEEIAFTNAMPQFPETVNKYEKEAKWNEFKKSVKDNYDIELVDGKPLAISKENKHKQISLEELVAKDSNIQALLEGRKQGGLNSKPEKMTKIEGVPFDVPKGADSKVRTQLVRDYLTQQGIAVTDPAYSQKFAELNKKLLQAA